MKHYLTRRRLPDLRAGELAGRTARATVDHLETCAACREEREREESLARELSGLGRATASVDVRARVLRDLPQQPPSSRAIAWRDLRRLTLAAVVLGAVLVIALIDALPAAIGAAREGAGLLGVVEVLAASVWRVLGTLLSVPFLLLGALVEPLERMFAALRVAAVAAPVLLASGYALMALIVGWVVGREFIRPSTAREENA